MGTETAEFLLARGCRVSVVEMLDKIAAGESGTILPVIQKDFRDHGVQEYVNTRVSAVEGGAVLAENTETGKTIRIPCDYVVMAVGSKKFLPDLAGVTVPVYYAGDCSGEKTADISAAIRSAYKTANSI